MQASINYAPFFLMHILKEHASYLQYVIIHIELFKSKRFEIVITHINFHIFKSCNLEGRGGVKGLERYKRTVQRNTCHLEDVGGNRLTFEDGIKVLTNVSGVKIVGGSQRSSLFCYTSPNTKNK